MGGVFFYSCALRGGNTGLCKEGEREVMARRGSRATGVHVHTVGCSSDVTVVAALCGGDTKVVSWTGGWLVVAMRRACAYAARG
jgi:hypothetical protein